MRRTFCIRLVFDGPARTVQATDYVAEFVREAGPSTASVERKAVMGLVFFQTEKGRLLGLQIDDHGHFRAEPTYTCKFTWAR